MSWGESGATFSFMNNYEENNEHQFYGKQNLINSLAQAKYIFYA